MAATSDQAPVYQFAKRAPELTLCQFLYNSQTGEVLGRTPISWAKITLFYIVYYTFLTAFFIAMLLVFFTTLKDDRPTWTMEDGGLIGSNPAMGFRPTPSEDNVESTLIWHGTDNGNWEKWVERLEEFVKGNCTREHSYGYKEGRPCILIKLNKIIGWTPQPYNPDDLPADLPQHLQEEIKKNQEDDKANLNNRIWLDCAGENPADRENLGPIVYHPTRGISANYFPYLNQEGYLSPAVFVEFTQPKHGVMIAVECRAWAGNIRHDRMERRGLAHFELMID